VLPRWVDAFVTLPMHHCPQEPWWETMHPHCPQEPSWETVHPLTQDHIDADGAVVHETLLHSADQPDPDGQVGLLDPVEKLLGTGMTAEAVVAVAIALAAAAAGQMAGMD